ncbi:MULTISPECIES: malonate decarboxylase subunit epsilon [Mixta]|uniref:malonate decarboxylase subunit epsilon n=1 Tax=Mixta TaxID=2100764 RepID=UPI002587FC78|nr:MULTISPECIES: malonate decarboxylase subunit epsilon [Mixta]MBS6058721.1 malonate decarboxylase subunit epsilon [Pantoea sp.]MCR1566712.1 malonate decarboxylase subunit epsilon [Mixta sp.]MDU4290441.1 malonate decarboxylase subunit epsilon [Mixta calida]MDU5193081.1 malonate decarboxylase subunit epsilon [Mixta calida]MDU6537746.1 malonate decarboxylase subunit epsilon [Mixta calida]
MKVLFMFPGQGPQRPGMLQGLPCGDELLAEASEALHEDVARLDSAEALRHTRAVQLCLLIAGVGWARELARQGLQPDMVSGLSIGAFPAAVTAGALDFANALRLVALRGELMEQAYPSGYGLTAITGLSQSDIEPLLGDCYLANINAAQQMVIAGSEEAMQQAAQRAAAHGAQKVHRLAVSVPSHCALLNEQARRLAQAFADVTLTRPRYAYLSGSTARQLWQPEQIADDLAMNMARTVRWHEAMEAANERDVGLALEMPPGAVLTGLAREPLARGDALSLERSGVALTPTSRAYIRPSATSASRLGSCSRLRSKTMAISCRI